MNIDFREIVTATMVLFAVIDIVGSIPIIIDLRARFGHIQSEKASIVSAVIMISFLFVGEEILKLRQEGFNYNEIASKVNCSKATVSYYCSPGQKEKVKKRHDRYPRFL